MGRGRGRGGGGEGKGEGMDEMKGGVKLLRGGSEGKQSNDYYNKSEGTVRITGCSNNL